MKRETRGLGYDLCPLVGFTIKLAGVISKWRRCILSMRYSFVDGVCDICSGAIRLILSEGVVYIDVFVVLFFFSVKDEVIEGFC